MKTVSKNGYPEIDEIRHDLESLKGNVVELTKHIKNDGAHQTQEMKETLAKKIDKFKHYSEDQLHHVEDQVKAKPGQSIAIAFLAGAAASVLLGRR